MMTRFVQIGLAFYFPMLLVGLIMAGTGVDSTAASDFNRVIQFNVFSSDATGIAGPLAWVGGPVAYFGSLASIFSLNFAFFEGPFQLARWAIMAVIIVPLVVELISRLFGR